MLQFNIRLRTSGTRKDRRRTSKQQGRKATMLRKSLKPCRWVTSPSPPMNSRQRSLSRGVSSSASANACVTHAVPVHHHQPQTLKVCAREHFVWQHRFREPLLFTVHGVPNEARVDGSLFLNQPINSLTFCIYVYIYIYMFFCVDNNGVLSWFLRSTGWWLWGISYIFPMDGTKNVAPTTFGIVALVVCLLISFIASVPMSDAVMNRIGKKKKILSLLFLIGWITLGVMSARVTKNTQ